MAKRKKPKSVETLTHDEAARRNIPTAEYHPVMAEEDKAPIRVAYERRNRDLDPQLVWRGKDQQDAADLVVQAPPLYIQEKVHPKVLIDDLLRQTKERRDEEADDTPDLFADFNGLPDGAATTEFYRHDANWSNRMILGLHLYRHRLSANEGGRLQSPLLARPVSGSACLGMLIPPSLLMVVWGILTDLSIGHLFIAGVIPGFMLAALMMAYIFAITLIRPDLVGHGGGRRQPEPHDAGPPAARGTRSARPEPSSLDMTISLTGLLAIMVGALGGIWVGFFTPTEGAGIGALISLVVAIAKGMRWPAIYETVLLAARTAIPLMIIVFAAQLYSRTLAMSGIGLTLQGTITGSGLPEWGIVLFMIVIWLVLGTLIDSISIMLLTVPIFGPVALSLGIDPLVFAIVGIPDHRGGPSHPRLSA